MQGKCLGRGKGQGKWPLEWEQTEIKGIVSLMEHYVAHNYFYISFLEYFSLNFFSLLSLIPLSHVQRSCNSPIFRPGSGVHDCVHSDCLVDLTMWKIGVFLFGVCRQCRFFSFFLFFPPWYLTINISKVEENCFKIAQFLCVDPTHKSPKFLLWVSVFPTLNLSTKEYCSKTFCNFWNRTFNPLKTWRTTPAEEPSQVFKLKGFMNCFSVKLRKD